MALSKKDYFEHDIEVLRTDIRKDFEKHWKLLDAAHREDHFREVEQTAMVIQDRLKMNLNHHLIVVTAYFHDLFCWSRENHHVLAKQFVETSEHPCISWMLKPERETVAAACAEHRATYTGCFTSQFSQLMNAADRCMPGNVPMMLERGIQYTMARGKTRDEAYPIAVAHLREKFGHDGYARYPDLYQQAFAKELIQTKDEIEVLYHETYPAA